MDYCVTKYRPIISKTGKENSKTVKEAFLFGDGFCPICKTEGRNSFIQERFGESS